MRFPTIRRRPMVGLALSGGGIRGFAHLGVLNVLEREGIPIDLLAGTSAGGAVAALRATGMRPAEIEERRQQLCRWRNLLHLVDRADSRLGLFSPQKVSEFLYGEIGDKSFSDLDLPLSLVAVDLESGEEVVLRQGSVLESLRATIAYPGIFEPVQVSGRYLVDGGLLNNLPCDVARDMGAEVVIAVDVSPDIGDFSGLFDSPRMPRMRPGLSLILEAVSRSVDIMRMYIKETRLLASPPDVLIRPKIPEGITTFRGFMRSAECVAAGERETEACLPAIRRQLDRWRWFK